MKASPMNFVDLTNQTAIVTGASRGLGQAYAIALAAAGASVAAVARSAEQLEETVTKIQMAGGKAMAYSLDVTDRFALEQVFQQIEYQQGPIDLLVNNAGVLPPLGPVWEIDPDDWWRTMEVNMRGALLCTRFVVPGMIARKCGRIINVASEAGLKGRAYLSPYGVSKTAVIRFSESLAMELAPHGVKVFAICPGAVRTEMSNVAFSVEGQKWLPWFSKIFETGQDVSPEEAVKLVLRLASGKYDVLSGRYMQVKDNLDAMYQSRQEIQTKGLYSLCLKRLKPVSNTSDCKITTILQEAIQHHQANRLTQAEKIYYQVLTAQPDNPEALHRLGTLAQQRGQLQEAEQHWERLLDCHPDFWKAWFSLGNLLQMQNHLSKAEAAYRRALALQSGVAPVYNNLGYVLQQQDNLDEAIICYQKALELQPNCVEAEASLGNVLYIQGKLSPERQTYYAALTHQLGDNRHQAGDIQTAIAYYRQSINLQPDRCETHFALGRALQSQKDWAGAIAAYRQGLELANPNYAEGIKPYRQTEANQSEAPKTPSLPGGEVQVGGYRFPAIPPVPSAEPRPFWSVIIPVYNRTDYVLECLASVLAQWPGHGQMEILVVDNASTPSVYELVNAIGGGIIRYYRHEKNLKLVGNINAGIKLSRGQWIHILHDDDYILPGFYSRLQHDLKGCSESIGTAVTGFKNVTEKGATISKGDISYWHADNRGVIQNWLFQIGVTNPLRPPAVVIRRSVFEHLGGYAPELEDLIGWEMNKRVATFYDCWYEPDILACYRLHTTPDTKKLSTDVLYSGRHAIYLRRAIEISESYFPEQYLEQITSKARSYNFNYLLEKRVCLPLDAGNMDGVLVTICEALKIDQSPQAVNKLFDWLARKEVASVREEIVTKLFL